MVQPLLADHLWRPHEGVGRRDHVADQEVAEVIAAHRDRGGQVGLGPEADGEDRREVILPRPAAGLGILGWLETQAGDFAAVDTATG